MSRTFACPECGKEVEAGRQAYKHAQHCLNIPDKGPQEVLRVIQSRNDAWADRVRRLLREPVEVSG